MSRPSAKVLKSLRRHLPPGAKVVVAVSGGVDSVTLLHACLQLARHIPLKGVVAAHLDHGFRKESADDARFVSDLCRHWGVECEIGKAGKPSKEENLEAFGRRERYRFFSKMRAAHQADFVLTAHSANDLAETLLMRLVANKELRLILPHDERRKVLRPLLEVSRREIEGYAAHNKLSFVTDQSNKDTRFLRNRVRHELIPLLEERFDKRIVEVLSARGRAVEEDRRALELFINNEKHHFEELPFGSREWLRKVTRSLENLPPSLQWRLAEDIFLAPPGFSLRAKQS